MQLFWGFNKFIVHQASYVQGPFQNGMHTQVRTVCTLKGRLPCVWPSASVLPASHGDQEWAIISIALHTVLHSCDRISGPWRSKATMRAFKTNTNLKIAAGSLFATHLCEPVFFLLCLPVSHCYPQLPYIDEGLLCQKWMLSIKCLRSYFDCESPNCCFSIDKSGYAKEHGPGMLQ